MDLAASAPLRLDAADVVAPLRLEGWQEVTPLLLVHVVEEPPPPVPVAAIALRREPAAGRDRGGDGLARPLAAARPATGR